MSPDEDFRFGCHKIDVFCPMIHYMRYKSREFTKMGFQGNRTPFSEIREHQVMVEGDQSCQFQKMGFNPHDHCVSGNVFPETVQPT